MTPCGLPKARDRARPALIFADVADNPGGGGRGNTMWILEAFHKAGVQDALVGVIHDPALAAEAHRLGEGASFTARFNRDGGDEFSRPFSAPAMVRRLRDGDGARPARHLCQQHARPRPVRRAADRRHRRRGDLQPLPVRRSDVLRGIRPRHRRRARRGGEVARPFPRRLRRILPPRPGDRGGRAGPDQPDPVALPVEAPAAPCPADRRRRQSGPGGA